MKKTQKASSKASSLKLFLYSKQFAVLYLVFACLMLFGTTLFWSWHSALLQQGNADQLVNSYLFENAATFNQAAFPSQHSFLLKWPLFYGLKMLHFNSAALVVMTVVITIITIGLFVGILRKFERRPLQLATLLLMMSSVLLLVPAQPGPGGLLPVNMAMIATRNLEYILYLACILGLAGVTSIRTKRFWVSVLALSVLLASDQFFVSISLAGGVIALFVYALRKKWAMVNFSVRWLAASLLAVGGSMLIVLFVNMVGLSHISGQNGSNPYQIIHSLREFVLGVVYGVQGVFTNFGANPGYSSLTLSGALQDGVKNILTLAILGFLVNAGILIAASLSAITILRSTLLNKRALKGSPRQKVVVAGVASVIGAFAAFVFSSHYYAGDARYLGLSFFVGFVCLAQYSSRQKQKPERIALLGVVLTLGIISAFFGAQTMNRTFTFTGAGLEARNDTIVHVLTNHKVDVLVGDYWRVIPVRQQVNQMPVMPLSDCGQPRTFLTSNNWQKDLTHHSFAYLISLDKPTPDFPNCSITQVTRQYGRPNSSVLIAGTVKKPQELLLFYDEGAKLGGSMGSLPASTTILPIKLNNLPQTDCPTGETVMNVVAHQDDDLLFMNPDVNASLLVGNCNRTVYVTAGDAGMRMQWLKREQGSEAAYARMLGVKDPHWVERTVELGKSQFVKIATIRDEPRVSLIFMHLPDGNLKGGGFEGTAYESLQKLSTGEISTIGAVDGQSTYTRNQLIDGLFLLMQAYQPNSIRTLSGQESDRYPDHRDHHEVAKYTESAYEGYQALVGSDTLTIGLTHYVGYPVRDLDENVEGDVLINKQNIFFSYAKFDGGVCGSVADCANTPTYDGYLKRQITSSY